MRFETAPLPNARLDIQDVLLVARTCEPRVLELLPAMVIRFPRHFLNHKALPAELVQIIECIKNGDDTGPNFEWLEYEKMKFWVKLKFHDKRLKLQKDKKIPKLFTLSPETVAKLKKLVLAKKFTNMSAAVEEAISKLS